MGHDLLLRAGHREVGAKTGGSRKPNEENQKRINSGSGPTREGGVV